MTWLFLAIAGALFESLRDIFSKKSLIDVTYFLLFEG